MINIQTSVANIINGNQELRKDTESLKESIQFNDEQVAIVKKENEELGQKKNALENEVYDLGQRVRCLEFNHRDDALEQYTRKFNVEVYGIPDYDGENLADHLREFFLLPHSAAFESYVKAFQFKVLNNILYTNKKNTDWLQIR